MRSSWTSIRQLSTFLSQGSETVPPHYARYPLDDTFGCFRADMAVCGRARTKLYLSFFKPENVWGSRGSDPLILDLRALDGSERSASRSGHFTSREKVKGTHWTRGWALQKGRKFLNPSGNRTTISELSRVSNPSEEYKLRCYRCACVIPFNVKSISTRFANLEYTHTHTHTHTTTSRNNCFQMNGENL